MYRLAAAGLLPDGPRHTVRFYPGWVDSPVLKLLIN